MWFLCLRSEKLFHCLWIGLSIVHYLHVCDHILSLSPPPQTPKSTAITTKFEPPTPQPTAHAVALPPSQQRQPHGLQSIISINVLAPTILEPYPIFTTNS
jgi:hypothetical protein